MHWSKFKLAIVISFDNKEFWQTGYNGPGGPMGPGGRMMGPGKADMDNMSSSGLRLCYSWVLGVLWL